MFLPEKRLLGYEDTYCLRGIAILMIIMGHTFNGYPTDDALYFFPSWLHFLHMERWGGMGVGIFFFLSGFGLFTSLSQRKGIDWPYVCRKAKRLFEPFLIYWIVEVITLALFNWNELNTHLLTEMATFSIHPDVENWFFKVILVVYLITLTLFNLQLRNATRAVIVTALSLVYLLVMRELGFGQWWYNTILCFPAGAVAAVKYEWFAKVPALGMSMVTACLMLVICYARMSSVALHLVFALFCIYAIRLIPVQRAQILFFMGYNSFIFYFMECPVETEIMMFCYPHFPLYAALSVLGTFVLSYICVKFSSFITSTSNSNRVSKDL